MVVDSNNPTAGSGGSSSGSSSGTQQQGGYLVSEAAQLLDIPERTLREWVRQGKIPVLPPTHGERGARITAETLEELRQARPLTWDGSHLVHPQIPCPVEPRPAADSSSSSGNAPPAAAAAANGSSGSSGGGNDPAAAAAANGRGEVAHQLCELPPPGQEPAPADPSEVEVLRARIEGAQTAARIHGARRADLERENAWLRSRVEHAEEAAQQLRLLLNQSERNVQALTERLTERPALEGKVVRPRRWWSWWRR